jgi:hypothetical protein
MEEIDSIKHDLSGATQIEQDAQQHILDSVLSRFRQVDSSVSHNI